MEFRLTLSFVHNRQSNYHAATNITLTNTWRAMKLTLGMFAVTSQSNAHLALALATY